jgi:hypothetical protein
MTERSNVFLWHRASQKSVDAILIDGVSRSEVQAAQLEWAKLLKLGKQDHAHWDWTKKHELAAQAPLAYRMFGIERDNQMQGLMLILTTAKFCREQSQLNKPLVYVDYLATAPWNSADVVEEPQYAGVGKILVRTAIQVSIDEEFGGRIGLHSLPKAEPFYRNNCAMTDLGPDGNYHNLRYFEMTVEQSKAFIRG